MRYLYGTSEEKPSGFTRRRFLKVVSLGTAGFMIGCTNKPTTGPTPGQTQTPQSTATPATSPTPASETDEEAFNAFVKIGSDDTVTVIIKHAEFGQGVTTGLTTIVAEELDARWDQMKWEFAPADASRYANLKFGTVQGTGGSSSIANSWNQLREAGAGAKAMLVAAAAEAWQVKPEEITAGDGKLSHKNGKSGTYGEFAAVAAKLTPPEKVTLKDPKDFKLIGKTVSRLDAKGKSTGQATFTIDVEKPGMVMACVAHSPKFGGKVKSVDSADAEALQGVIEVVQIPSGVAVVADSFWTAQNAVRKLKIEWDFSQAESRGSEQLFAYYKELAEKNGAVAKDDGDVAKAEKDASKLVEAEYEFPYLAHATMEPLDCVAELTEDGATLSFGSQIQTVDQANVAAALGTTPDKIKIESVFGGGSFGRRANPPSDYVVEAVHIAKALKTKAPVKLIRDRTTDLRAGFYRPMSYHKVRGTVDKDGTPNSYFQRIVCQSFLKGTPFEGMVKDGVDNAMVEGAANLAYSVPNLRVEAHMAEVKVPTLWWRSVGHTHNAFVTETFFDRLCVEGGSDPVEMRRKLLAEKPRHLGVLNLAVEKAGEAPKGEGKGRGVAVHESFESYVAEVVDVTMKDGKVVVDKVVCAVDCGLAVNPDIVKAQMESGIVFGLSAALAEEIELSEGEVKQANFDSYPVARMPAAPEIEVHIVPSAEPPSGVGEPGVPPLAPALANAIHRATGKWITKLPLKKEGLV
ncbi:MAG: xanthine dehydrogenase family protein molybdopterin-binding subunit [Candidatus Eremiobacteraeota bacterium]|nr:xanthine dehydrogenase family protein molybdopterin-binding subunit [Candidatus Eremiobacteraeota bacterium]